MKIMWVFSEVEVTILWTWTLQDLLAGISHTKHGNHIAHQHRKKGWLFGSLLGLGGVNHIKSMTAVERHAELTYAESLFEKVGVTDSLCV